MVNITDSPAFDEFEANERIKELRESLGFTRDQFSSLSGIGSTQLTNIEQKKQKAYAWHLQRIAAKWPRYAYWLTTGQTIPEAGQINPEIEESRKKLGKAG